jgi:hypothetical protein
MTLFAASFDLASALIGVLLLVTTTQSSAYPKIVHVSLIPLTISAIAIKNRVTLKTAPCTTLDFFQIREIVPHRNSQFPARHEIPDELQYPSVYFPLLEFSQYAAPPTGVVCFRYVQG